MKDQFNILAEASQSATGCTGSIRNQLLRRLRTIVLIFVGLTSGVAWSATTTYLTAYDASGFAGQPVALKATIEIVNILGFRDSIGGLPVEIWVEGSRVATVTSTSFGNKSWQRRHILHRRKTVGTVHIRFHIRVYDDGSYRKPWRLSIEPERTGRRGFGV